MNNNSNIYKNGQIISEIKDDTLTFEKEIISDNPLFDMFKELSLFEQTSYCVKYIESNILNLSSEQILYHADIASACFRQAKEYYEAGKKVSLSTRPLLYSYSINNYTKGMAYLTTNNDDILKGFGNHGFKYEYNNDFLNSTIKKVRLGAIHSLEKMVQDEEIPNNKPIPIHLLLALIPSLSKTFNSTTEYVSHVAFPLEEKNDFKLITQGKNFKINEKQSKLVGLIGQKVAKHPYWGDECIRLGINVNGQELIKKLKRLSYVSNNHIFIPLLIDDKAILVQPMVASYLTLMFYGMLVRYHAEKWDKIIDGKTSNTFSLVKISIEDCYEEFVVNLYRYIFKQRIIKKEYTNDSVKDYIKDNAKEILEILDNEKKSINMQYGRDVY